MRRGGILLEVLLALGIFVTTGIFALGASRTALGAMTRARDEALAEDIARSKLAELEAGLVSVAELREGAIDRVGSIDVMDTRLAEQWEIDLQTERTAHRGLTLVTITVRQVPPGEISGRFQSLVALRESEEEGYREDDIMRGLPEGERP
ncbi:MAG: hypothetical protein HKO59_10725 [Phycisphaerales bacterium]|nr:hypothetical protein [Phycisphaerae bacterium]NNF42116.1 hypothetical protein [Phycisphaerales bacterium]NNM26437.1 hypothetical protein [Phycisphaerales bacterium]